ncbi:MAG: extracellular solute-binding protein [Solirubrobacteraceae bacterium]
MSIRASAPLAAALAALALAACGASKSGPNTITLYNGQHEQTTALLVKAFEKQTGIHVNVRSADEATLGNQIVQEGANSPADVFYAENTPVLEALREKGLLAPLDAATLGSVPARYDSAQGDWVGVSARVPALVYSTTELGHAKLPSSILELAEPQWRAKVGFAPSETDFQPLLTAIVKLRGKHAAETWLKGLEAGARVYPDNETVVTQVNNGESQLGPIDHYYWYRLRQEQGAAGTHSALSYYASGDPGDLLNVSGAAVLRSSSKQAAAQKLLAFLVSRAGQEQIVHSDSWEYPLRPGVAAPAGLRPLSALGAGVLTPAQLGDGHEALALEQQLGLL